MTSTHRRIGALVVLGLLVVTAGCSGGGGAGLAGGDGGDAAVAQSGGAEPQQTATASAEDGTAGQAAQLRQREIVKTGQVAVVVDDFDRAQTNLTRTVRGYGGFVGDSRVDVNRVGNASYRRGMMVLRVPSENFSAAMRAAKVVGTLESSQTQYEDVTDRLVDIDARLENLRAERDQLRELYRNANDTEDVLAVQRRLSDVQGEIERLEAQQKELRRRVALSTIRVELREERPDRGLADTEQWYDTPLLAAFLDSVSGVIVALRALVVTVAYVLPYLLVFGPLLAGAVIASRRVRRFPGVPFVGSRGATDAETGHADAVDEREEGDESGEKTDEPGSADDEVSGGDRTSDGTDPTGDDADQASDDAGERHE